jgi:fermentation-respiration switch protein FrsA (DUF1100 family)
MAWTVPTLSMKMTTLSRAINLRVAAAVLAIAIVVSGCVGLAQKERELVFRVVREDAGWFSGMPEAIQEIYLPVANGAGTERIHAWWWPAADPGAPAVFYLHGSRWNLTGHLNRISQLRAFGFSVFAIDYRGFGKSDGELPSEESVYEDARVGWSWLAARQPDPARRYIYGHSLGGAVAIELATELAKGDPGARGLIIESSFTSLADMAAEISKGLLPAGLVLTQKFDSLGKIGQVHMPVLVVHGAADRFVPPRFSEALYAAAPTPKKLLLVENATHNNSMWVGNGEYQRALVDLFGLETTAARETARSTTAPSSSTGAGRAVNRARGLGVSSTSTRESE